MTADAPLPYNREDLSDTPSWSDEQFCYLTTAGRNTGKAHTIEIWFATASDIKTLYMLAGGGAKADWVRNIGKNPQVAIRVAERTLNGSGRVIEDQEEALLARKLVVAKYYGREYNPAGGWEATSLPVAFDLIG